MTRGLSEVLHDDDFRSLHAGHIPAVLFACLGIGVAMRFVTGFNDDRDCNANHGAHLRHEVFCFLKIKGVGGWIAAGDLFPAVCRWWACSSV
jgi:hypothetical protein